mmetsp:Transcript_21577/g.58028  ORF Transcript_21577/g.58028 Transcript_21577/m.58028 type:complete len:201 (+) Transcript_21577:626-1228(+)
MAHGCEESLRSSGGQEGLAVGSVARGERREELRHRVESARALEVPREQSRSHLRHLRLAQALLHVVIAGEGGEEDCARPADTRVGHVAAEQANGLIKGPKVHEGLAGLVGAGDARESEQQGRRAPGGRRPRLRLRASVVPPNLRHEQRKHACLHRAARAVESLVDLLARVVLERERAQDGAGGEDYGVVSRVGVEGSCSG